MNLILNKPFLNHGNVGKNKVDKRAENKAADCNKGNRYDLRNFHGGNIEFEIAKFIKDKHMNKVYAERSL